MENMDGQSNWHLSEDTWHKALLPQDMNAVPSCICDHSRHPHEWKMTRPSNPTKSAAKLRPCSQAQCKVEIPLTQINKGLYGLQSNHEHTRMYAFL